MVAAMPSFCTNTFTGLMASIDGRAPLGLLWSVVPRPGFLGRNSGAINYARLASASCSSA